MDGVVEILTERERRRRWSVVSVSPRPPTVAWRFP
jgi:hypothetical protein